MTGSVAAANQASAGNVVAGSMFAVLQSAGAGGTGLAVVNGVVGASATAIAVGATAPALIKAVSENNVKGRDSIEEAKVVEVLEEDEDKEKKEEEKKEKNDKEEDNKNWQSKKSKKRKQKRKKHRDSMIHV